MAYALPTFHADTHFCYYVRHVAQTLHWHQVSRVLSSVVKLWLNPHETNLPSRPTSDLELSDSLQGSIDVHLARRLVYRL